MRQTRPEVGAGVSDRDLSDLTVLVTGSTSGVGRETALALGRLAVLVHGRDRERGQAVATELLETGASGATFHRADFADFGPASRSRIGRFARRNYKGGGRPAGHGRTRSRDGVHGIGRHQGV
jgi:NAD(P)-dependent dehydrogenase (short-subunit alcohol dehydrogenase family)